MKLDSLDLTRCFFDPNKSSLLNDAEKFTEFKRKLTYPISKKRVIAYIVLIYDQESPLRREIRNLPARKGAAMQMVGFELNKEGRFERPVELILEGKAQEVNAMIVKYLVLQNSPKWVQLIAYESLYYYEIARIQNGAYGKTSDLIKNVDSLANAIESLTEEIIGGKKKEESEQVLSAIYHEVTKELNVSCEAIARYIEDTGDIPSDWNPYSEGEEEYKVSKMKYVGAE